MSYGLSEDLRSFAIEKITRQKKYIEDNNFVSYSPNINPKKYFSELNNRVDALVRVSMSQNLILKWLFE